MKKQSSKLSLKIDKIVILSKDTAQGIAGGVPTRGGQPLPLLPAV